MDPRKIEVALNAPMDVTRLRPVGRLGSGDEELVDLAGDIAFEAAEGFPAGLAVGDAAGDVVGVEVPAQSGQDDGVQGAVRSSVAATVQPAALGLAGGGLDRAHAAEGGDGSFVVEVAGGAGGDRVARGRCRGRPRCAPAAAGRARSAWCVVVCCFRSSISVVSSRMRRASRARYRRRRSWHPGVGRRRAGASGVLEPLLDPLRRRR